MTKQYATIEINYANGEKAPGLGGYIKTSAKTDKGLREAAMRQVFATSNAAMCGFKPARITVDGREI
jgi:hypothetical protein